MSPEKKLAQSVVISGDNNIVVGGNVAGSNIVTGDNNSISIQSDNQDYLLRKVAEELSSEGIDQTQVFELAEEALVAITRRIAQRFRRSFDEIWEALRRLGSDL